MAIAFVNGTTVHTASGTTLTLTYSPTAGNFVMVVVTSDSGSPSTQMVCKDNNGNVLPLVQEMTQRGDSHGGAQFCGIAVTGATGYTVTWSGASSTTAAIAEWSGVVSVGAFSKTEGGATTTWSNAQNITQPGNVIATGFGFCTINATTTTTTAGTLREALGSGNDYASIIDNTNTSGSPTTAGGVIGGTPFTWSCASVELVAKVTATTYTARQSKSSSSNSVAFTTNVVSGNLLLATIYTQTSATPTISDSRGNTWNAIGPVGSPQEKTLWWAIANSSGALTFTFNSVNFGEAVIAEFSITGAAPAVDTSNSASGVTVSTPALATGDLVVTVSATGPTGTPAGYTFLGNAADGSSWFIGMAYKNGAATGSQSATWPGSGGDSIIATFTGQTFSPIVNSLTMMGCGS
jgi:hypothetical protein